MVERIGRLCPEPGRTRCRRLHATTNISKRLRGNLGTAKRQDSTKAALARRPSTTKNFLEPRPDAIKTTRQQTTKRDLGRAALRPDEGQVGPTFGIGGPPKKFGILVEPVWKSKFYGAFVLNHRVVLHAIDATPVRCTRHTG